MKRRILLSLFGIMIATIFAVGTASADICWQIDGYGEIIKVSTIRSATGHKALFGTWKYVSGATWAVSGAMEKDLNDPSKLVVTLTGHTGSNAIIFYASVDKLTKNGSWTLTNATQEPSFVNSGTLTKVPCTTPYPAAPLGTKSTADSSTPK